MSLNASSQVGTYYVPEGKDNARHLRFIGDWFSFRNGQLWTLVVVDEIASEEPVLLNQYGAEQLLLTLLQLEPDPSDWVRVVRWEGGGWSVEKDEDFTPSGSDASDAM